MRVLLDDLLTTNATLVRSWVTDIRPTDTATIMRTRIGDRIVFPEDDTLTEALSIVLRPRMLLVVTKGATKNTILTLLNAVANGAVGAIGTHMGTDMNAVTRLASAGSDVLERVRQEVTSSGNVSFTIPVKDVQPNTTLEMTATASGWTRTTDYEPEDFSTFSYRCLIDTTGSTPTETENLSTQKYVPIDQTVTKVSKPMTDGQALCNLRMDWSLGTNGAFTHDTASTVQLAEITVHLRYI